MEKIIDPLSIKCGAPTLAKETTLAISHVVAPLSLKDVTVGLGHTTMTTHSIIFELSLIDTTIWVSQHPKSIHDLLLITKYPLSVVLLAFFTISSSSIIHTTTLGTFFRIQIQNAFNILVAY